MMRQALHILGKDVRHLRYEIALVALLSLVFTWAQDSILDKGYPYAGIAAVLLLGAAMVTLSQGIHDEALPGDRQFWLTRPYRWQSLLASKLLFLLLCINLPVFIGRLLIVVINGIPLVPALPGLLWSQVCLLVVFALPAAALAAITPGIGPFILVLITVLALLRSIFEGIHLMHPWPGGFNWIRDLIAMVGVTATCVFVFLNQYNGRNTRTSRLYGGFGILLVVALYWYIPLGFAFEAQRLLSSPLPDASSIQVRVSPAMSAGTLRPGETMLNVEIVVTEVPAGFDVHTDGFYIHLVAADGRTWSSGPTSVGTLAIGRYEDWSQLQERTSTTAVRLDASFFDQERGKPLTLSGSVYLTVFGNPREKTVRFPRREANVTLRREYVNVIDDLRCAGYFYQSANRVTNLGSVTCRSVSELSNRLVIAGAGEHGRYMRWWLSYSPLQLDLSPNPVQQESTTLTDTANDEVTFIVKDRIAHVRRDFQLTSVRLDEATRSK